MNTLMNEKFNILIVDDEEGIRETLQDFLQSSQFEIRTASSGKSAQQVIESTKIDFVISDIRMPNGDGIFLLSEIKRINPDIQNQALKK